VVRFDQPVNRRFFMKKMMGTMALATLMVSTACLSPDDPHRRTKQGAAVGAAAGAAAGAAVGSRSDNPRTGAVVGGVVGGAVGAAIGRRMDQQQQELQQIEGIEVTRTAEDELSVVLRNEVLFDFDSAALRPASRRTLEDMSQVFRRYDDTMIVVDGHTDSVGAAAYNQTLSERRARSVSDYLVNQGVARNRITARGFGQTQPRASNATPEGRQLNRRVELSIRAIPQ
jgi:outer membrane protein OmpA-like peptidoglycan-associated protein